MKLRFLFSFLFIFLISYFVSLPSASAVFYCAWNGTQCAPPASPPCSCGASCSNAAGYCQNLAQSACSPGSVAFPCLALSTACQPLGPYVRLTGQVLQCSPATGVSYELSAALTQGPLTGLSISKLSYSIQHQNQSGTVVTNTGDSSQTSLWDCTNSACTTGSTRTIGTSAGNGDPANFPNNVVNIVGSVEIMISDAGSTYCEQGVLNIQDGCTLGVTPTPAPQCDPADTTCGASGRCLNTQICNSSGNCELPPPGGPICHCDTSVNAGNCGGGGCPAHYMCQLGQSGGDCIYDDACTPCTDTSHSCGASGQCNILQQCIGGQCTYEIIACNQAVSPFCHPRGSNQMLGVNSAIGCIAAGIPKQFTSEIIAWATGIGGGLAFLMILLAAFQITTSSGNPKQYQAGKELLTAVLAGLLLIALAALFINFFGATILNLGALGFLL